MIEVGKHYEYETTKYVQQSRASRLIVSSNDNMWRVLYF